MQEVPFTEKRTFPRFTVTIPLTFLQQESNKPVSGQTHDISSQGVCMLSEQKLSSSSDLDIHIHMIDNNEKICLKGKVVWSCMAGDGKYRIGIKLEESKLKPIPLVLRTIMAQRKH